MRSTREIHTCWNENSDPEIGDTTMVRWEECDHCDGKGIKYCKKCGVKKFCKQCNGNGAHWTDSGLIEELHGKQG